MVYKTELLLTALDSLIESAHDRLSPAELQLLADIRAGIASCSDDQMAEEYFFRIVEFLLMIKTFFDNTWISETL